MGSTAKYRNRHVPQTYRQTAAERAYTVGYFVVLAVYYAP